MEKLEHDNESVLNFNQTCIQLDLANLPTNQIQNYWE